MARAAAVVVLRALALGLCLAVLPASADSPLLITVGEVTATGAVVWARGFEERPLTVEYAPAAGGAPAVASVTLTRNADLAGKVALTGLTPATRYTYRVRHAGESVEGSFVTAPARDQARPVTFLWSGDLGGGRQNCRHIQDGYPIFRPLAQRKPDFFLFVGDTTYADVRCGGPDRVPGYDFVATNVDGFREKHRYNRADPGVQEFFRSTSVYAIWDDHEVKNDFSGSSEPLMPLGRRAFIEYWPIQPPLDEPTRLYRKFRWGKFLEVFILDTRQYRSPNTDPDGPAKTMLGPAQRRWLIDNVSTSTAVWKAIGSSVPLSVPTGRTGRDSWSNATVFGVPEENATGFAVERDLILRRLRDRKVKNLVWLVADVHHAELIRHAPWPEFAFHEFIAGPLSATRGRPRPLDQGLNPRSLYGLGEIDNFGEIAIDSVGLTVRIVDVTGAVRFTHTIGPE
ncbi:MAG: alkaline phosphatase D family protein [Candidatus Rokubacteria bacterium]|nr:alkaline phosphatase D family protein [Candidatus Rokubacteria bacterium]